jgi:glutamine synthetase
MPPQSIDRNIFEMSKEEREALKIDRLPGTLLEAIFAMEEDEFVQDVLGKEVAAKYIEAKKKEWDEYRTQVSAWEIESYLYKY